MRRQVYCERERQKERVPTGPRKLRQRCELIGQCGQQTRTQLFDLWLPDDVVCVYYATSATGTGQRFWVVVTRFARSDGKTLRCLRLLCWQVNRHYKDRSCA